MYRFYIYLHKKTIGKGLQFYKWVHPKSLNQNFHGYTVSDGIEQVASEGIKALASSLDDVANGRQVGGGNQNTAQGSIGIFLGAPTYQVKGRIDSQKLAKQTK